MDMTEIEAKVRESVPPECQVVSVVPEGLEIVIYVKNIELFYQQDQLIKKIASVIKKKVSIRCDQSSLKPPEEAKEIITKLVPPEAQLGNIFFVPEFSRVMIEAFKPGLVIGKGGQTLRDIITKTGWSPKILRVPTIESSTLNGMRKSAQANAKAMKKLLLALGKKVTQPPLATPSWIRLSFLGAAQEIGRSCLYLQSNKERFLMDFGINPDTSDLKNAFPTMGETDMMVEKIDGVVLSHAHLDHSGFLPFLYKVGYDGPIYCTPPTKDLVALLINDMVDIWHKYSDMPAPYSIKDVQTMLQHMVTVEYGEVVDISPTTKLTFYNAGHILGSALCHLHVGDGLHNIVYTGDMKYAFTRLFNPADPSFPKVDSLIIESTYGGRNDIMPEREVMENQLVSEIRATASKGGKVLIPVFSVGRAQEIMLVLEEFARNDKDWNIPVYLDGMSLEASAIHTAYPEYLRKGVQTRILSNDSPFESEIFRIAKGNSREDIVNGEPAIILAPSGMLTGGPVIDFFRMMADNPNNKLMFVGYQSSTSLGRKIQQGVSEVALPSHNGKTELVNVNLEVKSIEGFSGHSDRMQTINFVRKLKTPPSKIFTIHGDHSKTVDLSKTLGSMLHTHSYAPLNMEAFRLK